MRRIAVVLLLGAFAFWPGMAAAKEDHAIEDLLIETADTPAEHTALANHFRAKADDARAEAAEHEEMAKLYARGPAKPGQVTQMQSHCRKIAESQKAIAAEYDALAKSHEDAAKAK